MLKKTSWPDFIIGAILRPKKCFSDRKQKRFSCLYMFKYNEDCVINEKFFIKNRTRIAGFLGISSSKI